MIRQQISLTNRLTTSPSPSLRCGGKDELEPNTADLRVDPPLNKGMIIHENIPVSVTKLTLFLWVGFISSHLTADLSKVAKNTLQHIHHVMNSDHGSTEDESPAWGQKHSCIDHLTKAYPCSAHGWLWLVHKSNQQGQIFVKNHIRIVSKPNVTPGQIPYFTTDSIPVDLFFSGKLYYSHTRLEPPEQSKWLPTESYNLSYLSVLRQLPVLGQEL